MASLGSAAAASSAALSSSSRLSSPSSSTSSSLHAPLPRQQPRHGRLQVVAVRPEPRKEGQERLKGIFEFVIDNPSSKGAIQLKNDPAKDGNLGQLIDSTRDKGRDYGASYKVGEFAYFIRQTGGTGMKAGLFSSPKKLVVCFHGAPAQSWSYKNVMLQLAQKGYRTLAADFLGYGFSEKPQPGYYFAYTEEAYHTEIDNVLAAMEVTEPFLMVIQGFFTGSYALTWALKNPGRISGLAIMNTPLAENTGLPNDLNSLRLPLLGEFVCQNAVLPERFLEGGSPYNLDDEDSDVYRLPYLDSGDPGFALLETARKYKPKDVQGRIAKGFSKAAGWTVPTTVLWGPQDPYLKLAEAEEFAKASDLELRKIEGTGHMPQDDWPEKVTDGLNSFFSRIK